jgi:hypothetical protein
MVKQVVLVVVVMALMYQHQAVLELLAKAEMVELMVEELPILTQVAVVVALAQ